MTFSLRWWSCHLKALIIFTVHTYDVICGAQQPRVASFQKVLTSHGEANPQMWHNRVQENAGDAYLQLKVLSMEDKAVIKARSSKSVLRRDSQIISNVKTAIKNRSRLLAQMGGVEAIGTVAHSRDTSC